MKRLFSRVLLILALGFFSIFNYGYAGAQQSSELLKTWEQFITLLEKKEIDPVKKLLSADIPLEFVKGLEAQISSKENSSLGTMKNFKFIKDHRSGENIVKLGFEVPVAQGMSKEYLWVIFKKEKDGYKILNFEPTKSLDFYVFTIAVKTDKESNSEETIKKVIEVLKKRLALMEYTNFNITADKNKITLEISGIETLELFKGFIVKKGAFSINQCFDENSAAVEGKKHEIIEAQEYPHFAKKELKKFHIAKKAVLTNESGNIKETKVTYSGLKLPQVQIDFNDAIKAELERYTSTKGLVTLACVLDSKVLSTFSVADKITSGRVWVEELTLVQTANLMNAYINAGPLPADLDILKVEQK